MQKEWRESLERHQVAFDRLIALNNMPIARYLDWLEASGNLESYAALRRVQPGHDRRMDVPQHALRLVDGVRSTAISIRCSIFPSRRRAEGCCCATSTRRDWRRAGS